MNKNEWTNKCMDKQTHGQTNGWTNKWMNKQMDLQTKIWTNKRTDKCQIYLKMLI